MTASIEIREPRRQAAAWPSTARTETARSETAPLQAAGWGTSRWGSALRAAGAQAVAFAAPVVTVLLAGDIAAGTAAGTGSRLWPIGACAVGFVLAANGSRRSGESARARTTGTVALGALAFATAGLALAPGLGAVGFAVAVAAAGVLGVASGAVVAVAGRVMAQAEVGDGSASVGLSAAALLAGIVAGSGALAALPLWGWRGVFVLVAVAGALAAWRFAALVPSERAR
ncbi:hypothetical protein [Glycomyces sp. NRRL B-16210]|uniref:hypothetical protein n=1 Tax=Glycomyces sp. NRRL B-16210 TaxID=1463821 RepID=UPI00105F071E|nr:hypothetical protein [Glycomyces sp. NRRL B-16210]